MSKCPVFRFPMPRDTVLSPPAGSEWVRAGGPVQRVELVNGETAWLVTGYDECREALSHPGVSSDPAQPGSPIVVGSRKRKKGPGLLIDTDPPEHTRLRKLLVREFSSRRVNALRPAIQERAEFLLKEIHQDFRESADLLNDFAYPLSSYVICDVLGVEYDDHAFFQELRTVLVDSLATPSQRDDAYWRLHQYLEQQVERKKSLTTSSDDVITGLLRGEGEDRLTLAEVTGLAKLLLFTGFETTAHMICLSVVALLSDDEQRCAALRDSDSMRRSVDECLRYFSTAALELSGRSALQDLRIGTKDIKQGEGLIIQAWFANHDERAFEDPDALEVRSPRAKHLAFGFGPHQCLGQNLVRAQMEIAIRAIFERYPNLRLGAEVACLELKDGSAAFGLKSLPVVLGS